MLELKNVRKLYHGKPAVDGVSFTVEPGHVLGMIGANGAGKSTCISMIATIMKPDEGEILFNGEDIVRNPAAIRRHMGYVPQDIALYESLTGLDNMRFWGKSQGVPAKKLDDEIKRVSGIIGFDVEMLKKRVADYSGGMKRRLNIGVALLHNPDLIILDEPTTGIDMQSGEQILESIGILEATGKAVIYVGHYLEEVERVSSDICIMDRGKVVAYGPKAELLRDGKTLKEIYTVNTKTRG